MTWLAAAGYGAAGWVLGVTSCFIGMAIAASAVDRKADRAEARQLQREGWHPDNADSAHRAGPTPEQLAARHRFTREALDEAQRRIGTCGAVSLGGDRCAESAGHDGMHRSARDDSGCVFSWPGAGLSAAQRMSPQVWPR